MAEQDPEHLSIPFLGEGESLAHNRLRVAVEQLLAPVPDDSPQISLVLLFKVFVS
jgi:hypothetical protein